MKKVFVLLFAALFILTAALSGCGDTKPAVAETDATLEETEHTLTVSDLISTVDYKFENVSGAYEWEMPVVQFEGGDAAKINKDIEDYFELCKLNSEAFGGDVNHTAAVNGDVLSLVLDYGSRDYSIYRVYNVSISKAAELSLEEFLGAAGMTEDEFYKTAKEACGTFFKKEHGEIDQSAYVYLNEALASTLSDENIKESLPFFGEGGKLFAKVGIHTIAGSEYYNAVLDLSDFEPDPEYDKLYTVDE